MESQKTSGEVCVLGMACRVGNANNIEKYWYNLIKGLDMVGTSEPRWPNKVFNLPEGLSVIPEINKFDYEYFGISETEADKMDPQIRLLLEVATEAILDSGVHPEKLSEVTCGVYSSAYKSEVEALNYPLEHCSTALHASKLAKFFHLTGPSMCIDCACSSSLVATNLAFLSLKENQIQYALVTATSLLLSPNQSLQNYRLGMTSATGKCHTWDESADGYVRAEGIFAILLGRGIEHPRLYAEIIAGSINSDGYKPEGITFPSHSALFSLFKTVYSTVQLKDVVYFECHATGTQAGDVAETRAICDIYEYKNVLGPVLIGSCKSNIGHAEWAAGLASFIKAVLCVYHKYIPPNLHLNKVNPKIPGILSGKLIPVTELFKLNDDGLVGVTAMGFGGSNCHLVIKRAKPTTLYQPPSNILLTYASRTREGLDKSEDFLPKESAVSLAYISKVFTSPLCSSMLNRTCSVIHGDGTTYIEKLFCGTSNFSKAKISNQIFVIIHDVATVRDVNEERLCLPKNDFHDDPFGCPLFAASMNALKAEYVVQEHSQGLFVDQDNCFNDFLSSNTSYILVLLQVLNGVGIGFEGCIGAGTSELIAAVVDGAIYHHNVLTIMKILNQIMLDHPDHKDRYVLEVDADFSTLENMFSLNIRVACLVTFNTTIISFAKEKRIEILDGLDNNKITYRTLLMSHPALYTDLMRRGLKNFEKFISNQLIKGPKERPIRSKTWVSTHYTSNYSKNDLITSQFIYTLLRYSVYLKGALTKIPVNSSRVHIGMDVRPVWVPEDEIYIQASSYFSILHGIGQLYLRGFQIDPNAINNLRGTITEQCLNVGNFMLWNHSRVCSVPHWLQFSATKKQEYQNSFVNSWNGSLESLLLAISIRIKYTFHKNDDVTIELHNLDMFLDNFPNLVKGKFTLHLLETSKNFKATDDKDNYTLIKGSYRSEDKNYTNWKTKTKESLEIDDGKLTRPIEFEISWQGNLIDFLTLVLKKLQYFMDRYDKSVCIQSFALTSSALPQSNLINTSVSFIANLSCGLCYGNGVLIKMSPVWTTEATYRRSSSNLNIPDISLDVSFIPSEPCASVEIHMMRVYQIQDCVENIQSLVLVYCGKNSSCNHNIGISLITKNNVTTLLSLIPVPSNVSCEDAVGIVVPYLLASSILQKVQDQTIDNLVIFCSDLDYLVHSLLNLCRENVDSVFVAIKDFEKAVAKSDSPNKTSERSTSSKSTPTGEMPLLISETKQLSMLNLSTTEIFTPHKTIDNIESSEHATAEFDAIPEIESVVYNNDNSLTEISDIAYELYSHTLIFPYNEDTIIKVIELKNKHIINLYPDLVKPCSLLNINETLLHMGEVNGDSLGIGICSQYGTIETINAVYAITKTLDDINDASITMENDFWTTMWDLLDKTSTFSPVDFENNSVYRSSITIPIVLPINLSLVTKQLQKKLTEKMILDSSVANWLGNLYPLIHNINRNRVLPVFESSTHSAETESPIHYRVQTSAPVVHFVSPLRERTEENFLIKMTQSNMDYLSPRSIPITVPLSRPYQPVLVKMNDVSEGLPVFLIHPVTGVLNLLRNFATLLMFPCYGLQQSSTAPTNSIDDLASFYLESCLSVVEDKPLQLIGYSYGACIAYVMAMKAQELNLSVSHLIMLDGSPDYVKFPLMMIRESYSPSEVEAVLDAEMLLAFLQIYGNVESVGIRAELLKASNRGERVEIIVNYLTNCDSPRPQNKWKMLSRQILNPQPKLLATTKTILLNQRIVRAYLFLENMDMIDQWTVPDEIFNGDVYLFRIKDSPKHCPDLPFDYGLGNLVNGNVYIKSYDVNHESLVGPNNVLDLSYDITSLILEN